MFNEDIHQPQNFVQQIPFEYKQFGFEKFERQYGRKPYFNLLRMVAVKIMGGRIDYTEEMKRHSCEFKEMISGKSIIHPFLEVGGAIRVQVPLPQNMEELKILVDVVLHSGAYSETERAGIVFGVNGFRNLLPQNSRKTSLGAGVGMLLWQDPCNATQAGVKDYEQSLFILLTSVIYQKADVSAYGKRGRYGAETVRRLIDGYAYQPHSEDNRTYTIGALLFEEETGFPFALYYGTYFPKKVKFSDENGTQAEQDTGAYTIQLNFTFVSKPTGEGVGTGIPLTACMIAGLLLEGSRIYRCPITDFYLAIHTDKTAAAKSTAKHLLVTSGNRNNCQAIARTVWTTITHNKINKFRSPFEAAEWPSVFFVDPSTVDEGDPAEEVPSEGDRFYKAVYPAYCKLVKARVGQTLSPPIKNGFFKEEELKFLLSENGAEFVHELTKEDAFVFVQTNRQTGKREKVTAPVITPDGRYHQNWPMNNRHSWMLLNPRLNWKRYAIATDAEKQDVGMLLNRQAKTGNTANLNYLAHQDQTNINLDVPRLTDFGFILVGAANQKTLGKIIERLSQQQYASAQSAPIQKARSGAPLSTL